MSLLEKNEMSKVGVQFGSLVRLKHPKMTNFIHTRRKGRYILDLNEVIDSCYRAREYISKLIQNKEKILFLSTKKKTKDVIKEQAEKCGMPYINCKWKPGFFTNFEEIKKKLKELQSLNNFIPKESFKKLAKKQQKELENRREKLQKVYEGVSNLWHIPNAIFIIGLNKERVALREAQKIGIPVIAICNVDCNPTFIDQVIIGNDQSNKSIEFFSNWISESIIKINSDIPSDE